MFRAPPKVQVNVRLVKQHRILPSTFQHFAEKKFLRFLACQGGERLHTHVNQSGAKETTQPVTLSTPAIEWPLPGTCGPWSSGSSNCRGF